MADIPRFELGLTMAGAISAGAYTAGVVDFLFEALDAIEDVRAGRDTSYLKAGYSDEKPIIAPAHDVQIRAMSGTSAGSMATAIVATILGTRVPPVTTKRTDRDSGRTNNPLYDSWVEDIHYDKLLSTSDVAGSKPVRSLLNSDPLDTVVKTTLAYAQKKDYLRPYIADPMPIFFCVSNLRGVRYSLPLDVDTDAPTEYQMSMHADWMAFQWTKGEAPQSDGFITLSPGREADKWQGLGDAALASGAFPIGLSPRSLKRDFVDYEKRKWYDTATHSYEEFAPLDKHSVFADGVYGFVNADGGIFNNEPLELCRRAIAGTGHNNRDPLKATRAVILIDPFPNLFDLEEPYDLDTHRELLTASKALFSAMISQARFKIDELALAHDPNVASRYAVMPVRHANKKRQKDAIASGSLGGFGGFLSKTFRHHDFMLGRRNCQRFLARYLVLPADSGANQINPLFANWKANDIDTFRIKTNEAGDQSDDIWHLPIVPLLGKLASEAYTRMPPWPTEPYDLSRDDLEQGILARADAVKKSLIAQYKPSTILRVGIEAYWFWKKREWIKRFAIERVAGDLGKRGIRLS